MKDPSSSAPRRRLLGRGLALVAGAIGLGLTDRSSRAEAAGRTPRIEGASGRTMRLYGRSWRLYGDGHRHGQAPVAGEQLIASGELLASPNGAVAGEFQAVRFATAAPFASGRFASGSVEFHTFGLPDGTIMGMGVAAGASATFAIVGGTGRYAGAAGVYVARQAPADLGGDGSADFTFTFTAPIGGTSHAL